MIARTGEQALQRGLRRKSLPVNTKISIPLTPEEDQQHRRKSRKSVATPLSNNTTQTVSPASEVPTLSKRLSSPDLTETQAKTTNETSKG